MISLLVINYRSSSLAIEAIRSARASCSSDLQVVVVDNSVDTAEAERLRPHASAVITPSDNLGYAAGINLGRRACTGDVLVVINPDVEFSAGALDALHESVRSEAAVAGPALFWDRELEWRLPPADLYTGLEKLDEAVASRLMMWARRRDQRRFRARVRFWSLTETTAVRALSGAVMAIRADVFDRLGGFDERFKLYFEENDFLRRVAALGESIVYVPRARCRHLYNQSAGADATRAGELFAASERAYLEKWNGRTAARALKRIEKPPAATTAAALDGLIEAPAGSVVEASPLSSFATAAGRFASGEPIALPDEITGTYRGDKLYLRVVDRDSARVIASYVRYRT